MEMCRQYGILRFSFYLTCYFVILQLYRGIDESIYIINKIDKLSPIIKIITQALN